MPETPLYSPLLTAVEAAATLAFALSGLLESARKRLDMVGVCVACGLTAFGGVLRDIVVNEIPRAFRDHQPYAVCAFAGGWMVVGAQVAGLHDDWSLLAGAAVGSDLRAMAIAQWPAAAALEHWRRAAGLIRGVAGVGAREYAGTSRCARVGVSRCAMNLWTWSARHGAQAIGMRWRRYPRGLMQRERCA